MKPRTLAQNNAIHPWMRELADDLNNRGLDMREVLKPGVEIPWDERLVKEHLVRPIAKAMFDKESTTELTTDELSKLVDVINRHLIQRFGFDLPFAVQ